MLCTSACRALLLLYFSIPSLTRLDPEAVKAEGEVIFKATTTPRSYRQSQQSWIVSSLLPSVVHFREHGWTCFHEGGWTRRQSNVCLSSTPIPFHSFSGKGRVLLMLLLIRNHHHRIVCLSIQPVHLCRIIYSLIYSMISVLSASGSDAVISGGRGYKGKE